MEALKSTTRFTIADRTLPEILTSGQLVIIIMGITTKLSVMLIPSISSGCKPNIFRIKLLEFPSYNGILRVRPVDIKVFVFINAKTIRKEAV